MLQLKIKSVPILTQHFLVLLIMLKRGRLGECGFTISVYLLFFSWILVCPHTFPLSSKYSGFLILIYLFYFLPLNVVLQVIFACDLTIHFMLLLYFQDFSTNTATASTTSTTWSPLTWMNLRKWPYMAAGKSLCLTQLRNVRWCSRLVRGLVSVSVFRDFI